jgi:hypothetical protein
MRLTKETILKIAGAFTVLSMPNLARAATEVAKHTPRGGWTWLENAKDKAIAILSGSLGTVAGATKTTEGFANSMAILAENIPLVVPYLKSRIDYVGIFISIFAVLVLYTFHRSGFHVSLPLMSFKKNGNGTARLLGSVPNANKKNIYALSMINGLPPAQKAAALKQYFAVQSLRGFAGLEQMAGSPGFRRNFVNVIENFASSVSRSRTRTSSIVNVTGNNNNRNTATSSVRSLAPTLRLNRSRSMSSSFSNANAARALMNLRR